MTPEQKLFFREEIEANITQAAVNTQDFNSWFRVSSTTLGDMFNHIKNYVVISQRELIIGQISGTQVVLSPKNSAEIGILDITKLLLTSDSQPTSSIKKMVDNAYKDVFTPNFNDISLDRFYKSKFEITPKLNCLTDIICCCCCFKTLRRDAATHKIYKRGQPHLFL